MKKLFIILASLGALLVFLVVIARVTNIYAVYRLPTESNLPTFKVGQNVLGTSLKKPKQGDFIAYKYDNGIWMHRCVALAGDIIELKNAELYINGKEVHEPYVYNEYKMLRKDFARIGVLLSGMKIL
ncbi:signal peptidase I [Mucilaginibacter roseus]|uniref:signal peptidase I n=1 Tax=Mucilaginibacter roseus TaxID=1528868 RepID=UPI0021D47DA7|nr:signal peptidase I [Mucilaginibacter roseus]